MGQGESKAKTQEVIGRVESSVGKVAVTGRYHRAPKKMDDDYEVSQKVLGSGFNGVVRMAHSKHNKSTRVAIKAFKTTGLHGDKLTQLLSEVEIFLEMDHPHVTRLMDVYEEVGTLNMVMECMEGGELFDRVTELKVFSEKEAADAVWQMLLALNYIHSHKIVHRDLKLENFLYDQKNSSHLKLIDFGFSKVWEPNIKMHVSCGTLSYVAPEVLQKNYDSQCDLWSLGVIVFILLSGYMPFSGTEAAQTANISKCNYKWKTERWNNVSQLGQTFVKSLLKIPAKDRLTAQQALDHEWVATRHKHGPTEISPDIGVALQQFGQASKFRRACLEMMAWSLSNEERAKVRDYFMMMDKNNQGTITLAELKAVMVDKFHIPDQETMKIFHALDSNHDDTIHYSDFLAAMVSTRIALHDDLLKATFSKFDTDNTGYITVANLKEVLGQSFDGEKVEDLLKEADFTHDNRISYGEFVKYIKGENSPDAHVEATAAIIDSAQKTQTKNENCGVEKKNRIVRKSAPPENQPTTSSGAPAPKAAAKPAAKNESQGGCCVVS
jgi:serine/threonine protein kinase